MDPYIVIEYGSFKERTKTKSQAGQFPIWNEYIEFDLKSNINRMRISCYDSDFFKYDDFLGAAFISTYKLCQDNGIKEWVREFLLLILWIV